jgi:hypothetical protein
LSLELEKVWSTSTPEELSKRYAKQLAQARRKSITEEMRKAELGSIRTTLAFERLQLNQYRQARDEVAKEKATLNVDHAAEQRRVTDLKAKLERALADCDLLLIPRMTLRNINTEERIPNRVYRLEDAQVEALKEFLKAGKPLLACFGPTNEPADRMRGDPTPPGPDRLEELLVELGVKFGKQTVLFGTDSKSFAERRSGLQIAGTNIKPPPVSFDWEPGTGRPKDLTPPTDAAPHQIRESMRITARGTTQKLDLNIRHPRPIYFEPGGDQKLTYQPEFLMSDRDSWNEENPFPSRERTPRFDVPKKEDPAKGTLDERRRGPFPLGVAADVKLPASWYADSKTNAATTRLAVIGHGGFFVGPELKPVEEQMLLHTCNWLLGRDDRLPQQGHVWKYPRVDLTEREQTLWWLGTQFGLPALFVYLGMVVWLVRRLR